ncbi:MAG TPA: peptidoglycan-binding protein [Solirubrobacteraceae bacterium]|nr:peptidoglycan-binding protein [Solirubrobacteraceae bacterium]
MAENRLRRRICALALALGACILGPLAAIAAAGSPPARSGGAGLVTTSSRGHTITTGTTRVSVTSPTGTGTAPAPGPGAGTTTSACSEPAVGTVTGPITSTTPSGSVGSGTCVVAPPPPIPAPKGSPFARRGMWIWELPATDGGNLSAIIAQARQLGIGTLFIKSGDGTGMWSQFTPALVDQIHAAGLHVCAWQYVYGISPVTEADVGIQAVHDGADCLVIDAETEYQDRYVQAQQYMGTLRAHLGSGYPIGLAGFPYVDYHPTFPYSVFLGPNGAQFNLPQMYWQDIGTSVDAVYAHTFAFNELYQRPIDPLGQLYNSPPISAVRRFRSVSMAYRTNSVSWWDWQSAGRTQLSAIAIRTGPLPGFQPDTTVASLARGAVGDLVVLAQEHLWNTPERVTIDGSYGAATQAAVSAFQSQVGLPVSGIITPQTWTALLKVPLPHVLWRARGHSVVAVIRP